MPQPTPRRSIAAGFELTQDQNGNLCYENTIIGNAGDPLGKVSLMGDCPAAQLRPSLYWDFFDDFTQQASATASDYYTYTDVNDGSTGTNSFGNTAGGWFNLVTAGAQDDYHGIRTIAKPWLLVAGKPLWYEARASITEADTNNSSWIFGLMDQTTTGGLQTGNSGPLSSFSGVVMWKKQGELKVNMMTSNSTTQHQALNIASIVSGQTFRVGFKVDGAATTSVVTPYVDIGDGNGWVVGTQENITLSGLAQMFAIATVKCGPNGLAETLSVDYHRVVQMR